ncbi:alpha-galactosidase [Xylanibacter brevis]|uniref:alpha-galactosidase n=1 Tax=Xylanibacter brevis TaxID=83231 RepID=UPI0005C68594|nr:alpha-galactosidase [Xylanibacter brevis]
MKKIFSLLAFCPLLFSVGKLSAKDVFVNTPKTTLMLSVNEGSTPRIHYYGSRISHSQAQEIYDAMSINYDAYPAFGRTSFDETALSVTHADGNMSTELAITGSRQEGDLTIISLKDKAYKFFVDLYYKANSESDVIETWTVIRNGEKKPIRLEQYASGVMTLRQEGAWITHFHGTWAAESQMTEEPLTPGLKTIVNHDGVRTAMDDRAEVMISLDGKPQENSGRVIGAALCWTGNYKLRLETRGKYRHTLIAGIDELHTAYTLRPGESFQTPELALTYSTEGKGGVSRAFHRWGHNVKLHNGHQVRDILLNSWEGVYMNVNQEVCEQMMDGIRELGGELFVVDDGWFGRKYRRTDDTQGLGDWMTDTQKLPDGVPALLKAAEDRGLKFGIWIEPEMTNSKSELYEAHPDWVLAHPTRELSKGRGGTQLVLDMSNPKVQDYVFSIVDNLVKGNPKLHYIKWDCNMSMNNYGSSYLTSDRQSHLVVDFHRGLRSTLERIRAKYPDLVIQLCAGGGGRVNWGFMPYFDEFWVSDDTDAQQRLFIQWGTSHFFPTMAMAQHVSASPNHQTGRIIPLKFRFDVAMTGRLGMEMKPSDLNDREREYAKKAVAFYKEIRPVIQLGDQYRLLSPYEGNGFCSQMFVTEDKSEAVFFCYKFEHYVDLHTPRWHMAGLDPDATYRLTEFECSEHEHYFEGKTFSGKFLMETGLDANLSRQFSSRVIRLKKI